MRKTVLFFTFFVSMPFYSQVGIGTVDPQSTLHVEGTFQVSNTNDVCDAEKKLQERTERWMGWRKNAQETIRVAKTIHKEKVKSLTTKHMEDTATETDRLKSQQYKLERSHTKQIVAMQNEIEKTKKNHELVQFLLCYFNCNSVFTNI